MSAPKTKAAPAAKKPIGKQNGSAALAPAVTKSNGDVAKEDAAATVGGSSRPDKAAYDAEQARIKSEIDALQLKVGAVKDKIGLVSKSGTGNDRRNALRAELDGIRGQQSTNKQARGKVFDQLKAIQENIQKKSKDLQTARGKTPFKTVAEIDAHIKNLEKQVESGSMKLADEKRALQEISQTRRSRKTVEGFQAELESIDADKAKADELRKQLDDPESKAVSDRYDTIKAELDEMKKESDEVFASRNKLFDERNALQAQLDTLYNEKRESAQRYRDANDRYWAKVNEDRARRAERARAQRAAEEEEKKKELATRLREEAEQPAFQVQIEDCQTLIDYFSGKPSTASSVSSLAKSLENEPKLDIRKVEEGPGDGMVLKKKKGAEEESYFVGGKGKKGKKGGPKATVSGSTTPDPSATAAATNVNVPLATLSALLSLSIPPPANSTDIPRVVEDLKTKKAWFEANQARVTAEAIAKAEADIKRITQGKNGGTTSSTPASASIEPPNGDGEKPPEPAPTPAVADEISTSLPEAAVDEKLEEVQEQEQEAEAEA